MTFRPPRKKPQFSHLKSGLSQANPDNALYQTIQAIIEKLTQYQMVDEEEKVKIAEKGKEGDAELQDSLDTVVGSTFLTVGDEKLGLENSRQLLAGANIAFDDATDNKRTISVTGEWTGFTPVMTNATISVNNTCKYALIGKIMIVTFHLDITVTGTPSILTLALPSGFTTSNLTGNMAIDSSGVDILVRTTPAGTVFDLLRDTLGTGNWPSGSNRIAGTATFPII